MNNAQLRIVQCLVALLVAFSVWSLAEPTPAQAAGVVGDGTPGSCDGNALQARLNGGGLVTFNCGPNPHTILANTYVITQNTTVDGGSLITLNGEELRQIFIVDPAATLALRHITLQQGLAPDGGCLYISQDATATAANVVFDRCKAELGHGGAVYNLGTFSADFSRFELNRAKLNGGAIFTFRDLTVRDSYFIGNVAEERGGGAIAVSRLLGSDHHALIRRSLFVGNQANTFGGAINNILGDVNINNSTFNANLADQGGALFADGFSVTTFEFSTLYQNRANNGGGLFIMPTAAVTLAKTIVAGSLDPNGSSPQLNCDSGGGSYTTQGYNIIGDNSCFNLALFTDQPNTDPQLGNLADNGGFTHTHMPNPGSPALNQVPKAQCLAQDQRRALRLGNTCDIGAAERGGALPTLYLPAIRR